MITRINGTLESVTDQHATVSIGDFDYQVLLADFARRQLQTKVGEPVSLHTLHYLEGNATQGRFTPRLVGFLTEVEREFFEMFCSVDGVGMRKALRAMVRPVQDVAVLIAEEDAKGLTALPGIGPATADRIVAKLKRKMTKFALLVTQELPDASGTKADVIRDSYETLLALGHSESDARDKIDHALAAKKKFKDVNDLLHTVYSLSRSQA